MLRSSEILNGNCCEVLATLPEQSVQCVVTSPPYWGLRDYGVDGQLGSEKTLDGYIAGQVEVFRAVWRVLRDDATLWLNMGDAYSSGASGQAGEAGSGWPPRGVAMGVLKKPPATGFQPKNLIGQPWRLAFALQADGWYLRSDIIWAKPNPMPESVTDRPTKSHEYLFLLTKRPTYYYDADAVREDGPTYTRKAGGYTQHSKQGASRFGGTGGFSDSDVTTTGRNLRTVWQIATQPYAKAHFATFPEKLVVPCIKAGTSEKGCCPECGAPWGRVVEKGIERTEVNPVTIKAQMRPGEAGHYRANSRESGGVAGDVTAITIGWQPGCGCSAREIDERTDEPVRYSPVPCTVLDPYAGSGTTGVVAKQLGRSFIGIELNPEYCEMARQRIANPYPKPEAKDAEGQEMLFQCST